MEIYQIMAVVDRDKAPAMEGVFRSAGTQVGLSQPARGTAGRDILTRYGLPRTEKQVVSTIANPAQRQSIFQMARQILYLDIPGNGILASIPVKAVAGRQTLAFLTDSEITGGVPAMEFEYELIVTILNEGYADLAMDAAREAGARGGTVLHAKGTGGNRSEAFFNVRFAEEKDMLYIVAHRSEKAAIMRALHTRAGPASEARGICFSLPISSVMGLRARESDGPTAL